MMKNILVATDLSERSDRAIARGILLARQFNCHLILLHVIDDDLPSEIANKQREIAERKLGTYLSSVEVAKDLTTSFVVEFGKDWSEIVRQSIAHQVDLIVLGIHRERGFEGLFRGTTVERVTRKSETPVLIVHDQAQRRYTNIVIGVDFSIYSRKAVEFALSFAPGSKLYLVHAYDVPFKGFLTGTETRGQFKKQHEEQFIDMIEKEILGFLSGINISENRVQKVMCEGSSQQVLRKQVSELNADLLVLGTHGRTGVAHALLGSVAESFLKEPSCDVLAVKAW